MQYQKFGADRLFDGYQMLESMVLVSSGEGMIIDLVPKDEAGDDIQHHTGILVPGFINSHCHLELSHMKDLIPPMTGLVNFVTRIIQERHATDEKIFEAVEKAEDEMLAAGIVAVGDICNNALTLPQKIKRRLHYHNFIEASGFAPVVVEPRFQRAVSIYEEYERQLPGINSIAPHAPYSVSDELWEKIIHFPNNKLLTIHNQETAAEDELFMYGQGEFLLLYKTLGIDTGFFRASGKSSLQSYIQKFLLDQQVILVHNVHTSHADLETELVSKNSHFYWCLCPNANRYITGELPDLDLLKRECNNLVLGTDSLASNQQLSILAEMQTLHRHFPSIGLDDLFRWGTINGAKALQMDKLLGSFEKGKQPGVVLVNNDLSGVRRLL